jgi:hypothetical protein
MQAMNLGSASSLIKQRELSSRKFYPNFLRAPGFDLPFFQFRLIWAGSVNTINPLPVLVPDPGIQNPMLHAVQRCFT